MKTVDGWNSITLGGVCKFTGGNGFREELQGQKDGDYPFIKVSDMELPANRKTIVEANNWIDAKTKTREAFKAFPELSVVFAKVGAALLLNRRRILTRPTCIDNNMMAAVPNGIDPMFLYYVLSDIDFAYLVQSGAVPSINQGQISSISFGLPNPYEQAKIAEILSTVDRTIEQTRTLIAKQLRIKTGLMQDLLTRGIDEHGNLRSEQTHQFKDSPLGRIPVEWEVEKWSQVCRKIQDGTHFSPQTESSAEFKYITSKNIKFGFLDLSDVEYIDQRQHDEIYKRCDVCLGDVLLTKDGANTGNAAINHLGEEFSLLSSVALLRPLENKLISMFLLQTILSESGQRLIKDAMSGLAITRITLEIINNFLIKVPPIQEQRRIGERLDVQDCRIKSEAKKLTKLGSLKTALMQDLLTGKKRVTPLLEAEAA